MTSIQLAPSLFQGGIAHICVYTKGLVENVIVGDELAALLRIVAVSGAPGDTIEVSKRGVMVNVYTGIRF